MANTQRTQTARLHVTDQRLGIYITIKKHMIRAFRTFCRRMANTKTSTCHISRPYINFYISFSRMGRSIQSHSLSNTICIPWHYTYPISTVVPTQPTGLTSAQWYDFSWPVLYHKVVENVCHNIVPVLDEGLLCLNGITVILQTKF